MSLEIYRNVAKNIKGFQRSLWKYYKDLENQIGHIDARAATLLKAKELTGDDSCRIRITKNSLQIRFYDKE